MNLASAGELPSSSSSENHHGPSCSLPVHRQLRLEALSQMMRRSRPAGKPRSTDQQASHRPIDVHVDVAHGSITASSSWDPSAHSPCSHKRARMASTCSRASVNRAISEVSSSMSSSSPPGSSCPPPSSRRADYGVRETPGAPPRSARTLQLLMLLPLRVTLTNVPPLDASA